MKSLTSYISIFCIFFIFSCSSDEDSNKNSIQDHENVFVKSYTLKNSRGTYRVNYEYNDTKLSKIKYAVDESFDLYSYTNDLITKIEHFKNDSIKTESTVFEYNSNQKLTRETTYEVRDGNQLVFDYQYSYPSESMIKVQFNSVAEDGTNHSYLKEITLNDQEIEKHIYIINNYTTTFTYDVAKNPFKNILGFNKLFISEYFGENGNFRNVVSKIYGNNYTEQSYRYNVDNYPTEVIVKFYEDNNLLDTSVINYTYSE